MHTLGLIDLIVMLTYKQRPREHSHNLAVLTSLFERDSARLIAAAGMLAALAFSIAGATLSKLFAGGINQDLAVILAVATGAFSSVLTVLLTVLWQLSELGRRYLDLIRVYYLLDRRIP